MDNDKETFETWNNIASVYQEKFMKMDLYNDTYDCVCNAIIKQHAKVLDIGCGPGNITQYLLSKRPDFDVFGIDIAPNMIKLAQKNNPTANFTVMDSRHINRLTQKFDAIISGFCLPYLSPAESDELISTSYDLLNENGLIYISFVEGEHDTSHYKSGNGGRVFFQFHPLNELKTQLTNSKFSEIETFWVKYKTSETEVDIHTIVIARKNNL